MIGIDTNVLLRFALRDDAQHSRRALDFLQDDERSSSPAMICPVVLVEFVWTLARKERFAKEAILAILDTLSSSERVVYSDEALTTACIEDWRRGKADLADYLIAALNLQAGARTTVTFDATAAREPGFSPIGI